MASVDMVSADVVSADVMSACRRRCFPRLSMEQSVAVRQAAPTRFALSAGLLNCFCFALAQAQRECL
eukprot:8862288-Alexandrium_andersonii.AAC.1